MNNTTTQVVIKPDAIKVAPKPNVLKDFFNMSHWETLLIVLALFISFIIMWYVIKKYKLKFQYRILMGLGIGIIFGIAIAGGSMFPGKDQFPHLLDPTKKQDDKTNPMLNPRWGSFEWGYEASQWFKLFSNVFISGLMIMILPIIFLSMARIVSKQSKSNLAGVTWKGIAVLLINVAVAFSITFWLGQAMNIGSGSKLVSDGGSSRDPMKSITKIITDYMPGNFFSVMAGGIVIVPVLVLGALVGLAIKKSTKRYPEQMNTARENLDRYWKIVLSVLMFIIKFMPYAILTMIANAIFSRPISEFAVIGGLIGLGYLGLAISYGWHVFTVWLFGISPTKFMKLGYKPVLSGFLTQSSMGTLPIAMEALKDDMKLGKEAAAPNVIMPLSTTMGLTGCAGVQSGVILTLLYNSEGSPVTMSLGIFFLLGLIITLFTSLGIAGVPGTATIVTIGVVSTIGYPGFVDSAIGVISPLNGIFDMGRTAANVNGGLQATLIASAAEGELPDEMKTWGPLSGVINKMNKKRLAKKAMEAEENKEAKPKKVVAKTATKSKSKK